MLRACVHGFMATCAHVGRLKDAHVPHVDVGSTWTHVSLSMERIYMQRTPEHLEMQTWLAMAVRGVFRCVGTYCYQHNWISSCV